MIYTRMEFGVTARHPKWGRLPAGECLGYARGALEAICRGYEENAGGGTGGRGKNKEMEVRGQPLGGGLGRTTVHS